MEFILAIILLAIGLFVLISSSDYLVDGAASIAYRFDIAPIVVGLTIVAFGTSTPELLVSVTSALRGSTELALGNIVGSGIANILLILGISAVISPLIIGKNTVWKEIPFQLLATLVVVFFGLRAFINAFSFDGLLRPTQEKIGLIDATDGLVLLALFLIFLQYTFSIAKISPDTDTKDHVMKLPKSIGLIIIGLLGLVLGSYLTVNNAIIVANIFNISENLIGLTIVAIGTSLPELVTSVSASLKKHSEIVIGNVVGSNIFNLLFVLGSTVLVRPAELGVSEVVDLLVLIGATVFLFISIFMATKFKLGRIEGTIMLTLYTSYMGYIFFRG